MSPNHTNAILHTNIPNAGQQLIPPPSQWCPMKRSSLLSMPSTISPPFLHASFSQMFLWPSRGLGLSGWALHCSCLLESRGSIGGGRQTCSRFTESWETRRTGLSRTACFTSYTLLSSLTVPSIPCYAIKTWRTCEKPRQTMFTFGLHFSTKLKSHAL